MHRLVRRAVVLAVNVVACAAVALPALAPAALAHTELEDSKPRQGARVAEPTREVTLVFSEAVEPDVLTVIVRGPGGQRYESGDAEVRGRSVTQATRPLGPDGKYEIAYRVVSADGHPVTGTVGFTRADAAPSPTATGTPTPSPEGHAAHAHVTQDGDGGGGPGPALWAGIAVAVLLAAGAGTAYVRRR